MKIGVQPLESAADGTVMTLSVHPVAVEGLQVYRYIGMPLVVGGTASEPNRMESDAARLAKAQTLASEAW